MAYINFTKNNLNPYSKDTLNEGQFSWMTQDTEQQIGSERQNTIDVYMYDNEGNQYYEKKYDGYGEFGGMDYYALLAKMNGYSDEDLSKKGMEMRDLGIDLAFKKLKTKAKGGKVLFPALVTDGKYNWKRHDFTVEAESDEYQSWYQEPDYDDDEYDESVVTEKFNFSKKEVEAAANLIASAISQADKVKAKVHDLEYDKGRGAGFEISIDGEKYDGGSYVVRDNGDVVNAAIGNSHPNAVYNTIGNKDIADVFINMEKYESLIDESVDAKDIVKTIKAVSKMHDTKFMNPFLMHEEPTHMHKELGAVKIHPGVPAYDWRRKGVIAVSTSLKGSKDWQFTGVDLKDLSELPKNFKLPKQWLSESVITEANGQTIKEFADLLALLLDEDSGLDIERAINAMAPKDARVLEKQISTLYKKLFDLTNQGFDLREDNSLTWDSLKESLGLTEAKFNKKSLMKAMKADDGMVQLGNGKEYVIYAYDNGNDDNDDMWGDKTIFGLDQDGEEHEIEYSDIVSYNESTVNEKDDAGTHLDNLADLVGNAKSFMNVGKELKAGNYKYDFSTGMMPHYQVEADGFTFMIVNKRYVDKGDREVNNIAIGLLESVSEQSDNESTVNEARSINKISKELEKTVLDMKKTVDEWKIAEGDRKSELLEKLRELNKNKVELSKELDSAVAGKDHDLQLAITEAEELAYLELDVINILND